MKIEVFETPFPYIRIYDFYTDEELELIWKEFDFILNDHNLLTPTETRSAVVDGFTLKNNLGFFLDNFYLNRNSSSILRLNRKVFEVIDEISKESNNWFIKNFLSNYDSTLVSYYENGHYYKKHRDSGAATCLTWFYKEPKVFEGGDLLFDDYDIKIKIKNNSLIFFPSIIPHSVSPISMDEKYSGKYMGRICISQFIASNPTL